MMKKSNKKGFTLVELIVVIAIMAILAAVLVPTVVNKINDAKESAAKSDLSTVANAIQSEIIAITTGTPDINNKYVKEGTGDNVDKVAGVKTPKEGAPTVQEDGKVTIEYKSTEKKFVITHKDLAADKTYEVNAETGTVTNKAQ